MKLKNLKNIKITYLAAILGAGIVLMLLSNMMSPEAEIPEQPPPEEAAVLKDSSVEDRLRELIEDIDGVSDVSVFVSYENNGVRNIAMSGEKFVTQKEGSAEQPFVTEEVLPQVRGVIIAAKGISTSSLEARISDAVASAMGVPIHRVKILSK